MLNFAGIVDHNLARHPDKVVLLEDTRQVTNRQLHARVNALAAALLDRGIGRNEIVALAMSNCIEILEAMLAVNQIGAVFLPLNVRLAPAEWSYILHNSEAVAVIAEPELAPKIDQIAADLPQLRVQLLLGDGDKHAWGSYERAIADHAGTVVPVAEVAEGDLHRLMYTSGTTSRPKGVPITYGNLFWKSYSHILELRLTGDDINLVYGPLYHVGALDAPALDVLHAGGTLVIRRKFDPLDLVRTVHSQRPTIMWLAPAMINAVVQLPGLARYDLSSLRIVLFGGEKTPTSLVEKLTGLFPGAWLSDAYGMTETLSADTFNDAAHALSKAGSVGRPTLHLAVRVVDLDGEDVAAGELGEIAMRGPQVFTGYWKDPAATAQAFRNGWFLTGDIGRFDEDGYLYVVDRKKDMIVSGGENIASSEVERVIYEHPDVLEAAVIAIADPRWGEVPKAFVVRRSVASLDEHGLREFCRKRLAGFKVPKAVEFIDSLPRNPSGKVLKRDLRHRHDQASEGVST
jgi:acyl-CoA synthetase (AMP-forming)/AMP-acid ligase II